MVLFFVYIPVLMNIGYSFFRLSSYSASATFVGVDNYRRFFFGQRTSDYAQEQYSLLYYFPDCTGGLWYGDGSDSGEQCHRGTNEGVFPEPVLYSGSDFPDCCGDRKSVV